MDKGIWKPQRWRSWRWRDVFQSLEETCKIESHWSPMVDFNPVYWPTHATCLAWSLTKRMYRSNLPHWSTIPLVPSSHLPMSTLPRVSASSLGPVATLLTWKKYPIFPSSHISVYLLMQRWPSIVNGGLSIVRNTSTCPVPNMTWLSMRLPTSRVNKPSRRWSLVFTSERSFGWLWSRWLRRASSFSGKTRTRLKRALSLIPLSSAWLKGLSVSIGSSGSRRKQATDSVCAW